MRIAFDAEKRRLTLENRGLDFADAPLVFAGLHFSRVDDRKDYGEVRTITIGLLRGVAVVMVWTERNAHRRIISMRKADRDERDAYFKALG